MIKIGAIQMDIALSNREKNLKRAIDFINEASLKGAEIVCLPEVFNTGFDFKNISNLAEDEKGTTITEFKKIAAEKKISIIAGSIAEKEGNNIYNSTWVINSMGKIIGKYRKAHLFPLMGEDRYFKKGQAISLVHISNLPSGIMMCYDIRFPELARLLTLKGAKVLFIPAEFPRPRLNHWRILLRARAIENQIYIVAVNRVGEDEHSTYFGHSMIIDPWGEIIAEGTEKEEIIYGNIDIEKVNKTRKKIPSLKDRREDLYYLSEKSC